MHPLENSVRYLFTFLIALVAICSECRAAQIYNFSGIITDVRDFNGTGIETYIPYGTAFSGSFTYDPIPDFFYEGATRGVFAASPDPVSALVGDYRFLSTNNQLQIGNGTPGIYFLSSNLNDFAGLPPSLAGYTIVTRIQLYGNIENYALPETLTLNNFPGFIGITGYSASASAPSFFSWHIAGNITSLEAVGAVPEPTTWTMLIIGFAMIGFVLRNRQSLQFAAVA